MQLKSWRLISISVILWANMPAANTSRQNTRNGMNTADRSLQALDYAVRRRFTFKKVKAELPDPKPPKQKKT